MKNRREVLTSLVAGATVGTAASMVAAEEKTSEASADKGCACCASGAGGAGGAGGRTKLGKIFPNATVYTHENQKALFYNDLIRDRSVLVNFMSVAGDATYPVTENLARVQRLLGDRVGRDVFMYSITIDPENDTPEVLGRFAAKHGVRPGWLFLTGDPDSISQVRNSFYIHPSAQSAQGHGPDCSLGLVRYGNDTVGTWGSVPAKTSPEWIARRVAWVQPRPVPKGRPRRKGPTPRGGAA